MRRILTITGLAILLAFSFIFLRNLGVTNQLGIWFPAGDENFRNYNEFIVDYGNDELTVIGVKSEMPMTDPENIRNMKALTAQLDTISYTQKSVSYISQILNENAKKKLLSDDLRSAAILLSLNSDSIAEEHREEVLASIRDISSGYNFETHIAGVTAIYSELNHITISNVSVFMLISFLVIFICAGILLRNLRMLLLGFISVITAVIITMGVMSAFNVQLNMITSMIPVLVLIYGLSDVIYIHYSKVNRLTIKHIATPCFMTSATTAIGYMALLTSQIPCLRELGIWGGAAVLIEFAVTFSIYTAFADWFNKGNPPLSFSRLMALKEKMMLKSRAAVLIISLITVAVFGWGMRSLVFDTNTIEFFRKDNRVRQSAQWISDNIMNTLPFEMLIKVDDMSLMGKKLNMLQDGIERRFGYESVSPADFSIMALYSASMSEARYVSSDGNYARVTVFLPMMSARDARKEMDKILAFAHESGIEAEASGYLPLYSSLVDYIQQSQKKSFLFSFAFIFIIITVVFGLRNGISSILPNLLPVAGVLGIMGYTGVRLDVGTVIITPIILGIVVDDTIHMLYAARHGAYAVKLPMFATSLSLVIGFSFLIFAKLTTIMMFGIFSAVAVILAYLGDAFILPVFTGRADSDKS